MPQGKSESKGRHSRPHGTLGKTWDTQSCYKYHPHLKFKYQVECSDQHWFNESASSTIAQGRLQVSQAARKKMIMIKRIICRYQCIEWRHLSNYVGKIKKSCQEVSDTSWWMATDIHKRSQKKFSALTICHVYFQRKIKKNPKLIQIYTAEHIWLLQGYENNTVDLPFKARCRNRNSP